MVIFATRKVGLAVEVRRSRSSYLMFLMDDLSSIELFRVELLGVELLGVELLDVEL